MTCEDGYVCGNASKKYHVCFSPSFLYVSQPYFQYVLLLELGILAGGVWFWVDPLGADDEAKSCAFLP